MSRQAHKLSQPSRSIIPREIIYVDTETTQKKDGNSKTIEHKLMLGVAIYKRYRTDTKTPHRDLYRFTSTREFWDFVEDKEHSKNILYLMSHNAVFDFTVLQSITNLSRLGYKCLFVYDNSMTFIAKWRKEKHTIIILNTANWFHGKLASWGDNLDLPKLTMPSYIESQEKWFIYCERDTVILEHLVEWYMDFLQEHKLGSWTFTIASQAFTAFRHKFMKHNIYIPDNEQEALLARAAYHGGRTECYQVGQYNNGPYYKLDINSMYPYIMKKYEYPTCLENVVPEITDSELTYLLENKCIIAECEIMTPMPYFCCVKDGRNVYPIGHFTTVLTSEEIRLCLENRWLGQVHTTAIYRARPIFSDYVDYFYQLKNQYGQEGKPLLRQFTKLYLNSLYGKFGQRGYKDKVIGEATLPGMLVSYGIDLDTSERYLLRQIGTQVLYSTREGESYNSFCAIAAHVTGSARLYLYKLVAIAGRENCYYSDTDSIIVNEQGKVALESFLDDSELGALKIEGVSNSINIVAPKHYLFDGHWTMKGISKDATQLGENHYEQLIWPGLNTILKSEREVYANKIVQKQLSPSIKSGIVRPDGTVIPFRMG